MSSRGAWAPVGPVLWDSFGRPYRATTDNRYDYLPPIVAAQYRDDPRLQTWAKSQGATLASDPGGITGGTSVPGGSFLRGRGVWSSEEGRYKQPINWGNLASVGIEAGMAAPFALGALGGGSGALAPGAGITPGAVGGPTFFGPAAGGAMSGTVGSLIQQGVPQAFNLVGNLIGNRARSKADERAAQLQYQSAAEALAFAREQEAANQRRYDTTAAEDARRYTEQMALERARWDAMQRQRAPYRAAADAILARTMGLRPGSVGGLLRG